jgi:plastocyanin
MLRAIAIAAIGLVILQAAEITGTAVITRKLTKKKVTPSAPAYHRGVALDPTPDQDEDPLAFERRRVVIYLEGDFPAGPVTAVLEQKHRRFVPDTLVIPAGSAVSFPNLDPIFHNVFSLSKPKSFDLGNYPKDHTRTVTFPKPGIVFVNCHLHPNMSAVIVVTPNRWSTRPDAAGRFVLDDVPPGAYTIVAWHKVAGFYRQRVQVTPAGGASVQFLIPLENGQADGAIARR